MKILIEIILRTFSIIKTHLTLFSYYKNYSIRLQHNNYKGWQNKKYSEKLVREALKICTSKKSKDLKLISYSGSPKIKKEHFIISDGEKTFYIKAFNNITFTLIIKNIFRSSKAMKFYTCTFEMSKRSIPVAEPVFAAEKKFLGIKLRSIIATEAVNKSEQFIKHYPDRTRSFTKKRQYLKKLAELICLLNNSKTAHADLLGNILVREISGKLEFIIIDNDAIKLFNNINRFDKIKHFEGFYNFFIAWSATPAYEDWKILCVEYLKLDPKLATSVEMLTDDVKNRKNLRHYIKKNILP